MCDVSGKLIAWMDHELPAEEAVDVERHLGGCSECRKCVDAYRQVTGEFDAYCDETLASNSRVGANPWMAVAAAVGAAASLVVLLFVWQHPRVHPPDLAISHGAVAVLPAVIEKEALVPSQPVERIRRTQAVAPAQRKKVASPVLNVDTSPSETDRVATDEPVIQIAIPAEEMFPPGAVPEGMRYFADVTIAADGSAERLRLRPRLAGFERSTTQP